MAAVLIIGNATTDAAVVRLQEALVARGHTVTLIAVAAFNADPATAATGQDAIAVATYDFDVSSSLATALLTVITATRGAVVGRPLQQASGWADGNLSPDTLACRIGIIDVEQAHPSGTAVDPGWTVADEESIVGSGFAPGFKLRMAANPTGSLLRTSRVPDDGIHGIRKAGTVNLYDSAGKAACVTTPPATSLVGHRNGITTEDGRMAWIGHQLLAATSHGYAGTSAWVELVEWAASVVDDEYPTVGTHVSVQKGFLFENFGNLSSSLVNWAQSTPGSTTVTVEARIDGGSYVALTNGAALPNGLITVGTSLNGKILTVRITLSSTSGAQTPEVSALTIQVNGAQVPLVASPTDFYEDGVLLWTSGANLAFPAREVRSYNPATREFKLFEAPRRTVAVGDAFTIYAGCRKRFAEDCVAKFANGINFMGEPHLPGQDAILKIPDAG